MRRGRVRVAVKVAYDGACFRGSQVQPDVRTVHSELAAALGALGDDAATLRWAGRTDAGVSARGNVAVFETTQPLDRILPAVTYRMEDAWAWAITRVDDAFDPRRAAARHYRYHLVTDLHEATLAEALALFVGTHDFSGFARVEAGKTPRRTVHQVAAVREGPVVRLDVEGESFLWNQVRRMVAAAEAVARNEVAPKAIERALASGQDPGTGVAPAAGLVLMDVRYHGVEFATTRDTPRILDRVRRRADEARRRVAVLDALTEEGTWTASRS